MASSNAKKPQDNQPTKQKEDVRATFEDLHPEVLMAARRHHCRPALVMHPELLMAARRGNHEQLNDLLSTEAAPARPTALAPQVVVDVHEASLAMQQTSFRAVAGDVDQSAPSAASLALLKGVTFDGDSALHVVATCGDSEGFLESAKVIYCKAKRLLDTPNKKGDTPLLCAARAGNVNMVTFLIDLARGRDGGSSGERLKAVLSKQNKHGETALHEAVRFAHKGMVDVLMSADPGLACVPGDDISPLYLAVLLEYDDIARLLYERSGRNLSYSGPDGQNALHAAALRSKVMTKMLLEWNKDLSRQADRSGSTPLHFAASMERADVDIRMLRWELRFFFPWSKSGPTELLLEANQSSAYQPDNNGSFPIHVAASVGELKIIKSLLAKCPDCAGLRNSEGRTFLHVAVEKKRHNIIAFACQKPWLASILNIQDSNGNTALHLAVQVGNLQIFSYLLQNRQVCLSLANINGKTPLDLSWSMRPRGFAHGMDPRVTIYWFLMYAGALYGNCRRDCFKQQHIPILDQKEESGKLTESTQVLSIGAVVVSTVAFGASFTLPGGYRQDDHTNGGTPTLARSYTFDAFLISTTLAFICSMLSTFGLMYSGMAMIDSYTRAKYFILSVHLLRSSARSLAAAFALGLYVVLAPVAHMTAIAVCVITSFTLLYVDEETWQNLTQVKTMSTTSRISWMVILWEIWQILVRMLVLFWSYSIIFGLPAYLRNHRTY